MHTTNDSTQCSTHSLPQQSRSAELPDFFEPLLTEQYADNDVRRIMKGCVAERRVTLRANTLRSSAAEIADVLKREKIAWDPVAWYEDAFIVRDVREKTIWALPEYGEGKVYVQSLSSMMPALALNAQAGDDVCDFCAAPGGKTTQIVALTAGEAFVTACEMRAPRAEKLEHNLRKLGTRNVTVLRVDARRLDDFFAFDRILLDAPCSGSGTLKAGNPKTTKHFTPELLKRSMKSQRALLAKALSLLKPGGTLVYSTCSVLAAENEDVVGWGIRQAKRHGDFQVSPISIFPTDKIPLLPTRVEGTVCLCPTDIYEGFFIAKITRND